LRVAEQILEQCEESLHAGQIGVAILCVIKESFEILDRLLGDDRGESAAAARVRADEHHVRQGELLPDCLARLLDGLDGEVIRHAGCNGIDRSHVEHEAHATCTVSR
jgi:hypothetical protein